MTNPPVGQHTICPRYANNACFVSEFSDPNAGYPEGLHKGCSPFEFETEKPQCNYFDGDKSICYQQCRSTNRQYCNYNAVKELHQCYVCTESFDHAGNKINPGGNKVDDGPENCLNLIEDEYLEDCGPMYDSCVTATLTDWYVDGSQGYTIHRDCHIMHPTESYDDTRCVENATPLLQYKDCSNVCNGNGCNNNTDVNNAHSRFDENGDPIELRSV